LIVLFCFVLFCFVLFCFVLFCFVLFCFVLFFFFVLFCFCFVLFCFVFVLFCFVFVCFVLFCFVCCSERMEKPGEKKMMDTIAEVQLNLHFMAGKEEGANAEKLRQEQVTRDLRREWILSQKRGESEIAMNPVHRFVEPDEVSTHVEGLIVLSSLIAFHLSCCSGADLDGDMSEYGIASSGPSSTPSVLALDGGYPCDDDLFASRVRNGFCDFSSFTGFKDDNFPSAETMHLSGSGDTSLSEGCEKRRRSWFCSNEKQMHITI
jgi:hypothetical protein